MFEALAIKEVQQQENDGRENPKGASNKQGAMIANYSPASPRNTFSDTLEDPSEYQLVLIAVSSFSDDPYIKVMQAYYATNEIPIPPPPAPIALPLSPIVGLQKKQMRHDDEVVLARVRISTMEMINKDIQVRHQSDIRSLLDAIHEFKITMDLLPLGFLEPLYPGFMNMVHNQDIMHMIPSTPSRDTEPPIGSLMLLSPSSSVGSSSPVRSTTPPPDYPFNESIFAELDNLLWIIPRPLGSEPISEEPNESDAC
nr:hypothetical protein [Tanacetum cinerariifolium]GEV99354.1 hypothetical protein [Tanacetum cinerariifolium]